MVCDMHHPLLTVHTAIVRAFARGWQPILLLGRVNLCHKRTIAAGESQGRETRASIGMYVGYPCSNGVSKISHATEFPLSWRHFGRGGRDVINIVRVPARYHTARKVHNIPVNIAHLIRLISKRITSGRGRTTRMRCHGTITSLMSHVGRAGNRVELTFACSSPPPQKLWQDLESVISPVAHPSGQL